jgi:CheY-like chemotaxis protein
MIARNLPKHSSLLPQLNDIERAGTEAATLVQDLQLIGGGGGDPPAPVNLNTVITECLNDPLRSARTRRHPEIRMRLQLAADLPAIQGSPRSLGRVAASLIDHALDAVVGKGLILVSTALEHIDRAAGWYESGPPGQYVTLRIKFSGPPLTDVELERIFEPSPTRPRRGLAMTLVYQVARQHGGFIQVHAEPAEGNEFVMYFAPASQPAPIEPEPARHLGGSETVMVVDDREELRRLAALQLQQQGYLVVTAENGEKAIALIAAERRGEHPVVDILVLDFLLGDGPDGVETFRRILEIKPHQKAIMVSGFAETERMMEGRRLGIGRFVQKPYSAATLGQAVRAELDRVAEAVSSV